MRDEARALIAKGINPRIARKQKQQAARLAGEQLFNLHLAQLTYCDRVGLAQARQCIAWQPVGLINPKFAPSRRDHGHSRNDGGFPDDIDDCEPLLCAERVEVVDKNRGAAVIRQFNEQFAKRSVEAELCAQRGPPARNTSSWAENDDLTFGLHGLGHLPQNTRFADACITTDLHIASAIQRFARCGNALLPCKYDAAHAVTNVSKCQAG